MKGYILLLVATVVLCLGTVALRGSTITWKNATNGNWSNAANWNPTHVPGPSDTAAITASGTYTVTLDVTADVGGLVLGANDGNTQTLALNGQTFTLAGQATINPGGVIDLSSGTFDGDTNSGGAVLSGTLTCSGGLLAGNLTLTSNSVLNIAAESVTNVLSSLTILTNYGTVIWSNTTLLGSPTSHIYNYGLWSAQPGFPYYKDAFLGNGTAFNNYGTFRLSGAVGPTILDTNTIFYTSGTVDNEGGTLVIQNGSGGGTFVSANALIGGIYFGAPGSEPYNFVSEFTLTTNATFTGAGAITGFLNGNNETINGTINAYGITLIGPLALGSNSVVSLAGPNWTNTFSGSITNFGTVAWVSGSISGEDSEIGNYGLWNAETDDIFSGGVGGGTTIFNNYGTFRKASGTGITLFDNYTTFNNYGTVDVQNGLLEIDGGYVLTGGTLNFGINSSTDFGSIVFSSSGALAGTLSVNFNNGYSPGAGTSLALLKYGSETGNFNSLNLPHLSPPLAWQTLYGTTTFTLSVVAAPPFQLSPALTQNGTNFSFSWNGTTGQTYQVQYSTNLAAAQWFNLGDSITGTNGIMTVTDVIGPDPQKFYRLVAQ